MITAADQLVLDQALGHLREAIRNVDCGHRLPARVAIIEAVDLLRDLANSGSLARGGYAGEQQQ